MPTTKMTKRPSKDSYLSIDLRPFKAKNGDIYIVTGTRAKPHTHDVKNITTNTHRTNIPHDKVRKWQDAAEFVSLPYEGSRNKSSKDQPKKS